MVRTFRSLLIQYKPIEISAEIDSSYVSHEWDVGGIEPMTRLKRGQPGAIDTMKERREAEDE